MYLRVSVSMIPAHGQGVFVCKAGEVITADSCSGCEAEGNLTDTLKHGVPAFTDCAGSHRENTLRGPYLNQYQNVKAVTSVWILYPFRSHSLLFDYIYEGYMSQSIVFSQGFNFSSPKRSPDCLHHNLPPTYQ